HLDGGEGPGRRSAARPEARHQPVPRPPRHLPVVGPEPGPGGRGCGGSRGRTPRPGGLAAGGAAAAGAAAAGAAGAAGATEGADPREEPAPDADIPSRTAGTHWPLAGDAAAEAPLAPPAEEPTR